MRRCRHLSLRMLFPIGLITARLLSTRSILTAENILEQLSAGHDTFSLSSTIIIPIAAFVSYNLINCLTALALV